MFWHQLQLKNLVQNRLQIIFFALRQHTPPRAKLWYRSVKTPFNSYLKFALASEIIETISPHAKKQVWYYYLVSLPLVTKFSIAFFFISKCSRLGKVSKIQMGKLQYALFSIFKVFKPCLKSSGKLLPGAICEFELAYKANNRFRMNWLHFLVVNTRLNHITQLKLIRWLYSQFKVFNLWYLKTFHLGNRNYLHQQRDTTLHSKYRLLLHKVAPCASTQSSTLEKQCNSQD